jgi:predicted methyltransferase MtxX (methanogen marker protein 4)
MSVEHVEVMVEEPSMEAALRVLLPKILGNLSFQCYSHLCKDDLLKQLPQRLRGYASGSPSAGAF